MTLDFDPIDEAAANWRGAGWAAVGAMTAATSITRAHQILSGRIGAASRRSASTSPLRGARPAVVHQGGRTAAGQGRRPTPGPSGVGHQHRQPARGTVSSPANRTRPIGARRSPCSHDGRRRVGAGCRCARRDRVRRRRRPVTGDGRRRGVLELRCLGDFVAPVSAAVKSKSGIRRSTDA